MIVDYRDKYDELKDIPAGKWTKQMDKFAKLWEWRQNDDRVSDRVQVSRPGGHSLWR